MVKTNFVILNQRAEAVATIQEATRNQAELWLHQHAQRNVGEVFSLAPVEAPVATCIVPLPEATFTKLD